MMGLGRKDGRHPSCEAIMTKKKATKRRANTRKQKMTPARKQKFLDHLREHGLIIMAAKHASDNSPIGCQTSFYAERERDPVFAAAWEEALEEADEALLQELKRRGIDGYDAPVWGSGGPGVGTVQVGSETKYSDKMAELYARVRSAKVRAAVANKVELSGTVTTETSIGVGKLSKEQQDLLAKILAMGTSDGDEA